jgi:acyl carrier protein
VTRQETIAAYLSNRFRSTLRRTQLGFDDPLISAGVVDSFGVLEVMAFLEDTFGIVIDPARHELTDFETVNRIADLVERAPRRS